MKKKSQMTNYSNSTNKEWVSANVPFQVQHLVDNMLNGKDNVYIRGNYRTRLDAISEYIKEAITKYDNELTFSNTKRKNRNND